MNIIKLTDSIAVAPQITPAEVAQVAAAGYRVLINNRPDGEEPSQPQSATIARAAAAAGLEYHYMPVNALDFPGRDFKAMCELMADADKPVLAFCRTGTRCTNLWVASQSGEEREAAIRVARQLGFDLSLVGKAG
jgi:uncharacterized protein (TIGR01244 family)